MIYILSVDTDQDKLQRRKLIKTMNSPDRKEIQVLTWSETRFHTDSVLLSTHSSYEINRLIG